jgi:hypothetical protein
VVLLPFLTDSFPFYLVDDYIQECYVSNLLSMTAYLPKHRVQILQLIISEMTKIDVSTLNIIIIYLFIYFLMFLYAWTLVAYV